MLEKNPSEIEQILCEKIEKTFDENKKEILECFKDTEEIHDIRLDYMEYVLIRVICEKEVMIDGEDIDRARKKIKQVFHPYMIKKDQEREDIEYSFFCGDMLTKTAVEAGIETIVDIPQCKQYENLRETDIEEYYRIVNSLDLSEYHRLMECITFIFDCWLPPDVDMGCNRCHEGNRINTYYCDHCTSALTKLLQG
jgi:hypothetical protein